MRKLLVIVLVFILACVSCAFVGCKQNNNVDNGPFCIVTFKNYDGTVLKVSKCPIGSGVNPPVEPTRPDDEYNSYVFNGWDTDLSEFNENTTVTAVFKAVHIIRITLILDGEEYYSEKYATAIKMTELPIPTAEGKVFDNWYTSSDYSRVLTIKALKEYNPNIEKSDIKFYGKWQ